MKHDYIDRYGGLNSPLHRLDPRTKIVAVFAAVLIIVTEPIGGRLNPFAFYFAIITALILLSSVPLKFIGRRLAVVSPFIIMAAIFYPVSYSLVGDSESAGFTSEALLPSLIIVSKATLSVLLLILLTTTEKFSRILLGLRKIGMPRVIVTVSALLYRYLFIIADETLKTNRARESRTPGRLRRGKLKVYGNQVAVIFLRSWDRSHVVYKSMLSRGFSGEFPGIQELNIRWYDLLTTAFFVSLLLAVRLFIR